MKQFRESFGHAFDGLSYVWREERNFRIQVLLGALVVLGMFLVDFSYEAMGLAVVAIVLVLTAETINTAFEDTLDVIDPNHNARIGKIKDIAAGVVVLCVFGAVAIGFFVIFSYFSL
jgi:diacylglycerol kinase